MLENQEVRKVKGKGRNMGNTIDYASFCEFSKSYALLVS